MRQKIKKIILYLAKTYVILYYNKNFSINDRETITTNDYKNLPLINPINFEKKGFNLSKKIYSISCLIWKKTNDASLSYSNLYKEIRKSCVLDIYNITFTKENNKEPSRGWSYWKEISPVHAQLSFNQQFLSVYSNETIGNYDFYLETNILMKSIGFSDSDTLREISEKLIKEKSITLLPKNLKLINKNHILRLGENEVLINYNNKFNLYEILDRNHNRYPFVFGLDTKSNLFSLKQNIVDVNNELNNYFSCLILQYLCFERYGISRKVINNIRDFLLFFAVPYLTEIIYKNLTHGVETKIDTDEDIIESLRFYLSHMDKMEEIIRLSPIPDFANFKSFQVILIETLRIFSVNNEESNYYKTCFEKDIKNYLKLFPFSTRNDLLNVYIKTLFQFIFSLKTYEIEFLNEVEKIRSIELGSLIKNVEKDFKFESELQWSGLIDPENYLWDSHIHNFQKKNILIHLHAYYLDLLPKFINKLKKFPYPFCLEITSSFSDIQKYESFIKKSLSGNLKSLSIKICENKGRDVAPWLVEIDPYTEGYDVVGHFHLKKSIFDEKRGSRWFDSLLNDILAPDQVLKVMTAFNDDPLLGIVIPRPYEEILSVWNEHRVAVIGLNENILTKLLSKMGYQGAITRHDLFFSVGTMYWYRPQSLSPLRQLKLSYKDFEDEPIPMDGTLAHAIERLPGLLCKITGYKIKSLPSFQV